MHLYSNDYNIFSISTISYNIDDSMSFFQNYLKITGKHYCQQNRSHAMSYNAVL